MRQHDRFVHDRLPPPTQQPQILRARPEFQFPQAFNLTDFLFEKGSAHRGPNAPLFQGLEPGSAALSYRQAAERADQIAHLVRTRLGLASGSRVLIHAPNSAETALVWLGLVKAGMVAVATMPLLRAKELGKVIRKAEIAWAVVHPALVQEVVLAAQEAPSLQQIITLGVPATEMPAPLYAGALGDLLATKVANAVHAPNPPFVADTDGDDIALLAFTSGTTGDPKAVVHTHHDVAAACEAWPRAVLRPRPTDLVVGSPPLAFTFGLGGMLVFPMWAGASVYYPNTRYTPETLVQTIAQVGATTCYTAPTFYRQMVEHIPEGGLPSLTTCVSAGEALPPAIRDLWRNKTGIELTDGIGATEMFHIFISSAPEEVRAGAIGRVVPGYEAQVVDDEGKPLADGEIGRLRVRGPTGCRYLADPRQTNYVKDGWNYPGDAFRRDAEGYFYYQSRTDDMIISAGYNISGLEVESVLLTHPAVAECGVVGAPDEERGMRVKAFVVVKPDHRDHDPVALTRDLQDYVKATIAPYKYPREIVFVQTLPRTETGKLQRFRLRETS
ncbi:MAG: AMP-binding protein [Burkholderiaceae bacterium]